MHPSSSLLFVLALTASACGPAPGQQPSAPESVPARPGDTRPEGAASTPLARAEGASEAPLLEAAETVCARAERWLEKARELAGEGWVRRPARLLRHASASCPGVSDPALKGRLERARVGSGSLLSLEQAMERAWAAGEEAQARTLSAQWLTLAQAQLGAEARWLPRPAGRGVGLASDASWAIVARDHGRRQRTSTLTLLAGTSGVPTHVFEPGAYVVHAERIEDRLLTVSREEVTLWSLASGKALQRLKWSDERYTWATFLDGGKRVVALGEHRFAGVARVFDAANGDSLKTLRLPGRRMLKRAAMIDGRRLLAASDEAALVIDLRNMTATSPLDTNPTGEKRAPKIVSLAATAKGRLAVSTQDRRVAIWDGFGKTLVTRIESAVRLADVAFREEGRRLLLGAGFGFSRELRTYEVGQPEPVRSRKIGGEILHLSEDGEHLLVARRGAPPLLESAEGKALWASAPQPSEIGTLALSEGMALTRERRRAGADPDVEIHAWYRGLKRELSRAGYLSDVLDISPSGRRVAAVTGPEAVLWDVASDRAQPLPTPRATGSPELLLFAGEARLRAMYERPATTHVVDLPFTGWQEELRDSGSRGPRGAALSVSGAAATRHEGRVTLVPDEVVVASGGRAIAFSQDGSRLFAGEGERLAWFDADGQRLGEVALACAPRLLGVDRAGSLVAMKCGGSVMTLRPPSTIATFDDPSDRHPSLQEIEVSPAGHLIALRARKQVRFLTSDLSVLATLELLGGEPMVRTPQQRLWYLGAPAWRAQTACRIGHRAFPFAFCEDAFLDDALVERLLIP